jgi:hypothetical protein
LSDTDKLDDEMRRGRDAERLLEEPLYVEAKAAIRKELIAEWEAAPARDTEGRERIWLMLKMLAKIEANIASHITTGKLASKQLSDIEGRKKIFGVI